MDNWEGTVIHTKLKDSYAVIGAFVLSVWCESPVYLSYWHCHFRVCKSASKHKLGCANKKLIFRVYKLANTRKFVPVKSSAQIYRCIKHEGMRG